MRPLRPKREGTDTNQAPATVERPRTKIGRDPSFKEGGKGRTAVRVSCPGACPESENTLQILHRARDISQICAYYYYVCLHKYLPTLDNGGEGERRNRLVAVGGLVYRVIELGTVRPHTDSCCK